MHMTRSVPQHDVVAAGHPLQVIPKIAVRGEQYLLSLQRPDDFTALDEVQQISVSAFTSTEVLT